MITSFQASPSTKQNYVLGFDQLRMTLTANGLHHVDLIEIIRNVQMRE
jgi:hypothetical protein